MRLVAGIVLPFVLLFGCWQLLTVLGPSSLHTVLASPYATVSYIVQNKSSMLTSLRTTAYEALLGYVIGNVAGFFIAFVLDIHRHVGHVGMALLVVAQSIPVIAFGAVIALWFGQGLLPRVVIATYIGFFPMALNVNRGLRAIDPSHTNLFDAFDASHAQATLFLRVPAVLPSVFTALKASAVLCVSGAIVGELFGAQYGLGPLLLNGIYYQNPPLLWSSIYLAAAISLTVFGTASILQRRLAWW